MKPFSRLSLFVYFLLFLALSLFPLSFLTHRKFHVSGHSFPWVDVFMTVLVGILAWCAFRNRSRLSRTDRLMWGILVGGLSMSVICSLHPSLSWKPWGGFVIRGVLPALFIQTCLIPAHVTDLLKKMSFVVWLAALNGLVERCGGFNVPYNHFYSVHDAFYKHMLAQRGGGILGTLGHPLPYAVFLGMFVPVVAFLPIARRWRACGIVMFFAAIIFSQSRSGLLVALVGLTGAALCATTRLKLGRARKMGVVVATAVFLLALFFGKSFLGGRFRLSLGSDMHRFNSMKIARKMVADHPLFGLGWGNYELYYDGYRFWEMDRHTPTPDNQYLRIASETGLVGTLSFLIFVIIFWSRLIRKFRTTQQPLLFFGLVGGLVGGSVGFMLFDGFFWPTTQFVFWSFIGFCLNLQQSHDPSTAQV
jgi:hypothetical protein